MQGAYQTTPLIPQSGTKYTLSVRVDNLGQTDATDLQLTLYTKIDELGWQPISQEIIIIIPGSESSSGYEEAQFVIPENLSKPGGTDFRAVLEGDGVDSDHNSIEFTILTDNVRFSNSQVRLNLLNGESVVDFVGMDEGGLIFTTVDGELHVRTVQSLAVVHGQHLQMSN